MRIQFSTIGKQLSARMDGAIVREQIAKGIEQNQLIVLDFDGVEVVSNSFADECFAKLMLEFDLPTVKAHNVVSRIPFAGKKQLLGDVNIFKYSISFLPLLHDPCSHGP